MPCVWYKKRGEGERKKKPKRRHKEEECEHNLPDGWYPNCRQMTLASSVSKLLSQMVPQILLKHTSTRPSLPKLPSTIRKPPSLQSAKFIESAKNAKQWLRGRSSDEWMAHYILVHAIDVHIRAYSKWYTPSILVPSLPPIYTNDETKVYMTMIQEQEGSYESVYVYVCAIDGSFNFDCER